MYTTRSVEPVRHLYADETQEEWSPDFRTPKRTGTGITEAGLAEIKPHKRDAIRKGLAQLRAYLQRTPNTRPERRSIWLITYLPSPAGTNTPTHVRVFAHKLKREELLKKGPIPPLDDLVLSRRELPAVGLPPSIPFPSLARPDMFGLAVESIVRDAFEKSYGRPGAPPYKQAVGRHGPDVLWRELAGLFRELAEETGERYWRELAEELLPEL